LNELKEDLLLGVDGAHEDLMNLIQLKT